MTLKNKVIKNIDIVLSLLRGFPYISYLIMLFPIYAIIISNHKNHNFDLYLFLVPIIFTMSSGFLYNSICDVKKDPPQKNPITKYNLNIKKLTNICLCLIIAAIYGFFTLYDNIQNKLIAFLYVFLWMSYSGLKLRFKETILAPFIASIVLWVGPQYLLLLKYNSINSNTVLLTGFFLIYSSFEINHTIGDYAIDLEHRVKTFAVRLGLKRTLIFKHIFLLAGIYFLYTIFIDSSFYFGVSFVSLSIILQIIMLYFESNNLNDVWKIYNRVYFLSPFFIVKMYAIYYGLTIFNFTADLNILIMLLLIHNVRNKSI